ncbi:transmembrane protein 43 homolog [Contarinia nasturtii]|uniref:transmembrane protein 43 homolog n=1 Tax=Contarinia nasturtii TaxID=265458 RepID=UPI0012D3E18E|nr:transmembrane protein 43 homolog [Contarinia nasturtii]XP_031616539.1 transmembrane protein 43 homolog [Contarinia nasturtii]XP_031616541.1 transmembrane protein 43 homolog [Contarinia nasturtii]
MSRPVSYISWAQRKHLLVEHFQKSWLIVIFGLILFVAGFFVLNINERRTARKIVSLDEALSNVKSVRVDENQLKAKSGQLLHIVARLYTDEPLTEPDYNIQVQAVKLKRRVQMYQWIEESVDPGFGQSIHTIDSNDKTYYYTQDWRDDLVDSSLFHMRMGHENPKQFPIKNRIQTANHVFIGNYELGPDAKSKINDYIEITSDTRPEDPSVKLHSGLYYHCYNVFNPEIGDIRLQFLTAGIEGNFYTIIAQYDDGLLVPFVSSINSTVLILIPGRHTIEESFDAAHYERKLHAWALRFIGWVLIFFSTICTSELLTVFLGDIRLFAIILPNPEQPLYGNVLLSFSLAIILIALCWLVLRPWLAFGMLFAAISPFIFCARNIVHSYHRLATQID